MALKPNFDAMVAHLEHLFGSDLGVYADGMIEIAWTSVSNGNHRLNKAKLYAVTDIHAAAGEALLQNGRGSNVYVGVALRRPGTAPFARAGDKDAYCFTSVCFDLDEPKRAENAKNIWGDMPPTLAVMTGRTPHARLQAWYRLASPCGDFARFTSMQKALAGAFDGDPTVTNPSRVMRLAGSIAHPAKPGRIKEATEILQLKSPGKVVALEQIEEKFSQFVPIASAPSMRVALASETTGGGAAVASGSFDIGPLTDGRERYMLDTALACLKQYIGENGAAPTVQELHDISWPQFQRGARSSVAGKQDRTEQENLAKCSYTIARFHEGKIASMPDLDAALATYKLNGSGPYQQPAPPQDKGPTALTFTPYQWRDPKTIPHRQFVYGRHYIRKFASTTVAPGGAGKSSLAIVEALAMVSGKPLLGVQVEHRRRVMLWNGEDPREETERRIAAAGIYYNLDPALIEGLYFDSGRDLPIVMAKSVKGDLQIATPVSDALIREALRLKLDVISVDPFVSSHHVTENDNNAIDAVVKEWARVAEEANLSVDLVHHSRKTNGEEVGVEDGRGASAMIAAVRSARVINPMTKAEAAKVGIENNRKYFRCENGKSNMAPPPDKADWFELLGVSLGNGDNKLGLDNGDKVAVVKSWQLPDLLDGVTGDDFERAVPLIRRGDWRENHQADNWVGIPISQALKIDRGTKHGKARIKGVIKSWLEAGSLHLVDGKDHERHPRVFVRVRGDE